MSDLCQQLETEEILKMKCLVRKGSHGKKSWVKSRY